jgi:hypothetical protein
VDQPWSEWLRVMLDEIARKRQDAERAADEARARAVEAAAGGASSQSRARHRAQP